MKIEIIVAMAENRIIGTAKNTLPWHIREDLIRFRNMTIGSAVFMGRKTFESIGGVLPGRKNIVLSKRFGVFPTEVAVFSLMPEAIGWAKAMNYDILYIIGGRTVYERTFHLVDKIHMTLIHDMTCKGTIRFPVIDPFIWMETNRVYKGTHSYLTLERIAGPGAFYTDDEKEEIE